MPPEPLTPHPTDDGFDTLFSPVYGQTYHSRHGALVEARHVFLEGSSVADRLAQGLPTQVLEVGFGTGLNFLLTAHRAAAANVALRYVALEKEVLPAAVLARLNHGSRLGATALRDALLAWRRTLPDVVPLGRYPLALSERCALDLVVGDATRIDLPDLAYDAVYLDAFSPDVNPELWTPSFLARLFAVMREGGTLATYSARGVVRRSLESVGFRTGKRSGPPGKREMLVAVR